MTNHLKIIFREYSYFSLLLFFLTTSQNVVGAQQELSVNPNLRGLQGTAITDLAFPVSRKVERAYYLDKEFVDYHLTFRNRDTVLLLPGRLDVFNNKILIVYKSRNLAINFIHIQSAEKIINNNKETFIFLEQDNTVNCFKLIGETTNPMDGTKVQLLSSWETSVKVPNYNTGLDVGNKTNTILSKEVKYLYIEKLKKFIRLPKSKSKLRKEIEDASFTFTSEGYKSYNLRNNSKLLSFFKTIRF